MQAATITYEDTPGNAGTYSYSLHVRGDNFAIGLNRTLGDADNSGHERATSEILLEEILP